MAPDTISPDPIVRVVQRPLSSREHASEPVTIGVPFPAGLVRDARRLGLADDEGVDIALQALPTELWPDGSVRWALCDFCSTAVVAGERSYRIVFDSSPDAVARDRIRIDGNADEMVVDTGAAAFTLRVGTAFPFARVIVGSVDVVDRRNAPALVLTDARGRESRTVITRIALEHDCALRSTIRIEARAGGNHR